MITFSLPTRDILVCLFAILIFGSIGRSEGKEWPHVLSSRMMERSQSSLIYNTDLTGKIIFEHPVRMNFSSPQIIDNKKWNIENGFTNDMNMRIWGFDAVNEKYQEYLESRDTVLQSHNGDAKLIDWCIKNKLDIAAEYELIRVLQKIRDFNKKEYQLYNKKYLKYADKRQINYTFPLPVKGEWFVILDRTKHHRKKIGATYAFDLVIKKNGVAHKSIGRKLSDHYCWGKPVIAQADGVVVVANDQFQDMPIGKAGNYGQANGVAVYYGGGIAGFYAHLKKGSVKVKVGDVVKYGDELGLVGNSGASGMPHLHFTMMNTDNISLKGRYSYHLKKGSRWVEVNGEDIVENRYIRDWSPELEDLFK